MQTTNLDTDGPQGPQKVSQLPSWFPPPSTSSPILWKQPSDYALSPQVRISVKLPPARKRPAQNSIDCRISFRTISHHDVGGGDLEYLVDYGEAWGAKTGATKASSGARRGPGQSSVRPQFEFVEAARKGRYSQFSSFDQFKKDLERKVSAAKKQEGGPDSLRPSLRRSGMARRPACGPGEMVPVRVRRI